MSSPKAKGTVLRPVRPNAGLEAAYRKKLDVLIQRMHGSLVYWLSAEWRGNTPELASDASPARDLQGAMRTLRRRWNKEFDKLAVEWGPKFVRETAKHTDSAFAQALKQAGFTVPFKTTAAINDVIQASVGENVTLIKSIAEQHLSQVEGAVMRSVQAGRDLGSLTQDLEERYGVTRRRAAFIARDQNNKATAVINRARQLDLGIEEAIWLHSHGGRKPRPSHVEMDGKRYEIAKGMWDPAIQRFIQPGTEPNCRCVSRPVIPGLTRKEAA